MLSHRRPLINTNSNAQFTQIVCNFYLKYKRNFCFNILHYKRTYWNYLIAYHFFHLHHYHFVVLRKIGRFFYHSRSQLIDRNSIQQFVEHCIITHSNTISNDSSYFKHSFFTHFHHVCGDFFFCTSLSLFFHLISIDRNEKENFNLIFFNEFEKDKARRKKIIKLIDFGYFQKISLILKWNFQHILKDGMK